MQSDGSSFAALAVIMKGVRERDEDGVIYVCGLN